MDKLRSLMEEIASAKPIAHGERNSNKLHYRVVDLPQMPEGSNSVTIFWKVSFFSRVKLLFSGRLQTSFLAHSVPRMRVEI